MSTTTQLLKFSYFVGILLVDARVQRVPLYRGAPEQRTEQRHIGAAETEMVH